jgi:hypothetical protein
MTAKHTLGPWRVETTEADGGTNFIYAGAPGNIYCIARLMRFTGGIQSDSANARLIAAAPDLLEALRPFADIGIGSNPEYQPMIRLDRDAIIAARAAIAKATGGEA